MNIAVLPGDGIGPEITEAALRVLEQVKRTLVLNLTFDMPRLHFATIALVIWSAAWRCAICAISCASTPATCDSFPAA